MVKRKGRLPRQDKGRLMKNDPLANKSLRLRREKKMTSYTSGLPPREELERVTKKGEQLLEKGKQAGAEIEAEEAKTREKVLPEIASEFEREVKLTQLTERLPERVPEPPKVEKKIAEVGKKVAPVIKTAVTKSPTAEALLATVEEKAGAPRRKKTREIFRKAEIESV